MHAAVPTIKPSEKPFRRNRWQDSRSFHSRTLAEWTKENTLYEVEFSSGRGQQVALRRDNTWFDQHGARVGVSEEVLAIYFPARRE